MPTVTEEFRGQDARKKRDARWRQLKAKRPHVGRSTTQEQEPVRLKNGKMVEGEMVYLVFYSN